MNYLKKNLLFLVLMSFCLGFFFSSDMPAMSKKCADIGFSKCETKEVFGSKSNEKFLMIFNDAGLFKNQTLEAYNKAFQVSLNRFQWTLGYKLLIKSLEDGKKGDMKHFFHAIVHTVKKSKCDEYQVVSFIHGEFEDEQKRCVYITHVGTVPDFEKNGFAWTLIESIFNSYPYVDKVWLSALESATSFYMKRGFKWLWDLKYGLSRNALNKQKIWQNLGGKVTRQSAFVDCIINLSS